MVPSAHSGQITFPAGQVTVNSHLPDGQASHLPNK